MKKLVSDALNEISPEYIAKAAQPPRKGRYLPWVGAVAAVLALVLLANVLFRSLGTAAPNGPVLPGAYNRYLAAAPVYPDLYKYPGEDDMEAYDKWSADQYALHKNPPGYSDNLQTYFEKAIPLLLTGDGRQNTVCSPLNIYIALAMLAETTAGESQEQILELLEAGSIEALRTQAQLVWRSHYNDDGLVTSVLGNSLWLHQNLAYNEQTADRLAEYYYASVFRGDLASDEINVALRSWLNAQTGGLLQEQAGSIELDPDTILALASTVYYQVQWQDRFSEEKNTQATFHGTVGDSTETFMNKQLSGGPYYRGHNFGAVNLLLKDGSRMWLFLPDEGASPEALLADGNALRFLSQAPEDSQTVQQKPAQVNLSIPKFDIASGMNLKESLQELGITEVFKEFYADFSPIFPENDAYVDSVTHAARVTINEEGVTAAAFTVIQANGTSSGAPLDEVDFVLDRPFLFVIESQDGLPLFAGTVHQP